MTADNIAKRSNRHLRALSSSRHRDIHIECRELRALGGVVLVAKRLEKAQFKWPAISDGVMRLSAVQFAALFEGLDWRRVHAPRVRRPEAVQ
jgi:hypothetical protein